MKGPVKCQLSLKSLCQWPAGTPLRASGHWDPSIRLRKLRRLGDQGHCKAQDQDQHSDCIHPGLGVPRLRLLVLLACFRFPGGRMSYVAQPQLAMLCPYHHPALQAQS